MMRESAAGKVYVCVCVCVHACICVCVCFPGVEDTNSMVLTAHSEPISN